MYIKTQYGLQHGSRHFHVANCMICVSVLNLPFVFCNKIWFTVCKEEIDNSSNNCIEIQAKGAKRLSAASDKPKVNLVIAACDKVHVSFVNSTPMQKKFKATRNHKTLKWRFLQYNRLHILQIY